MAILLVTFRLLSDGSLRIGCGPMQSGLAQKGPLGSIQTGGGFRIPMLSEPSGKRLSEIVGEQHVDFFLLLHHTTTSLKI